MWSELPPYGGPPLCAFSRAEMLSAFVLSACPLGLTRGKHKRCQCRQRQLHHVRDTEVRVSVCLYPLTWRGERVG